MKTGLKNFLVTASVIALASCGGSSGSGFGSDTHAEDIKPITQIEVAEAAPAEDNDAVTEAAALSVEQEAETDKADSAAVADSADPAEAGSEETELTEADKVEMPESAPEETVEVAKIAQEIEEAEDNDGYPDLADVPERPELTPRERAEQLKQELLKDRASARKRAAVTVAEETKLAVSEADDMPAVAADPVEEAVLADQALTSGEEAVIAKLKAKIAALEAKVDGQDSAAAVADAAAAPEGEKLAAVVDAAASMQNPQEVKAESVGLPLPKWTKTPVQAQAEDLFRRLDDDSKMIRDADPFAGQGGDDVMAMARDMDLLDKAPEKITTKSLYKVTKSEEDRVLISKDQVLSDAATKNYQEAFEGTFENLPSKEYGQFNDSYIGQNQALPKRDMDVNDVMAGRVVRDIPTKDDLAAAEAAARSKYVPDMPTVTHSIFDESPAAPTAHAAPQKIANIPMDDVPNNPAVFTPQDQYHRINSDLTAQLANDASGRFVSREPGQPTMVWQKGATLQDAQTAGATLQHAPQGAHDYVYHSPVVANAVAHLPPLPPQGASGGPMHLGQQAHMQMQPSAQKVTFHPGMGRNVDGVVMDDDPMVSNTMGMVDDYDARYADLPAYRRPVRRQIASAGLVAQKPSSEEKQQSRRAIKKTAEELAKMTLNLKKLNKNPIPDYDPSYNPDIDVYE